MTDILRIAAAALAGGALCLLLKREQPVFAFLLSACGAIALFVAVAARLEPLLDFFRLLSGYGQGQAVSCLIQVVGIALAAQFAADTCRDAGMQAAATGVELGGRALALVQALPLLQTLADTFLSFLQ